MTSKFSKVYFNTVVILIIKFFFCRVEMKMLFVYHMHLSIGLIFFFFAVKWSL